MFQKAMATASSSRKDALRKSCSLDGNDDPQATTFALTFRGKGGNNDVMCVINPTIVRGYFLPTKTAPFLGAITSVTKTKTGAKDATSTPNDMSICDLVVDQYEWSCNARRGMKEDSRRARAKKALNAAETSDTDVISEAGTEPLGYNAAHRRRLASSASYVAYVDVYGVNVDKYLDEAKLKAAIASDMVDLIQATYGTGYPCSYDVDLDINPSQDPSERPTHMYDMAIGNATLYPDGYPLTGNFYGNGTTYFGDMIEVEEEDLVLALVHNHGNLPQATHWHGMNVEEHPYNDGAVGTSQGTLHVGKSYMYTFNAYPPGTTWYHGHIQRALLDGNRGLLIVHKSPCHDPHLGTYDEERVMGLTEAMPWGRTDDNNLRHITSTEDFNAFMNGDFDNEVGPREADYGIGVLDDAGVLPFAEQPWGGVLVNGQGRSTPIQWNKDGIRMAENAGEYYTVPVEKGKKYRFRLIQATGVWGYRVIFENHDMNIITIAGNDIEPYKAPEEYGVELEAGERYDLLIHANKAHKSKHLIRMESPDGCYKSAAWLLYDGATLDHHDIARADAYQANRTCDSDCYNDGPCDYAKSFSSDHYFLKVKSLEYDAVPPPNPDGATAKLVIQAEGLSKFVMNSVQVGAIKPPLYKLHEYDPSFHALHMPLSATVAKYSFRRGQVVDWCTINYSPDRHPMHMHGTRFWILGTGTGNECVNQVGEGNPTVKVDVLNTDVAPLPNAPTWILFRARIDEDGAFPYHCHLAYHQYKSLVVPVVSGADDVWPTPPDDLPMGRSDEN